MKQSRSEAIANSDEPTRKRAIAYYRSSSERRQENSIPIQQVQVREWASKNGVEIIHEFFVRNRSGNSSEDRTAFTEMMEEWITKRTDFAYVLCLDGSRLGRLQDHVSAQLTDKCKKHRKLVICTSIGKSLGDDLL